MSTARFALFLTVALSLWAAIHSYVFWRLDSIPWVAAHVSPRTVMLAAAVLWASYPLARILEARGLRSIAVPLEFVAANWMGVLFLVFSGLLVVDVVTLGGWFMPGVAPALRGWLALIAILLSGVALVHGLRSPVERDYEVQIAGLPVERDGLLMVAMSDLHLGTIIGRRWIQRVVERVNGMRPDIVLMVGDILEGEDEPLEKEIVPSLAILHAPLGVWAVTGNHEFYNGIDRSVALIEKAGCTVLRDRWAEAAPGLVVAGVDDLTARPEFGLPDQPVEKALANRPPGAVILLCHTPRQADIAAANGAGLMISGHTHNGQIWPFNYLVRLRYPLLGGRYEVDGMSVIVCRGTGTWGPRMRLWKPSEIIRIRLLSQPEKIVGTIQRRADSDRGGIGRV